MADITRWSPGEELGRNRLNWYFDRMFRDLWSPLAAREEISTRAWMPAVDIRETDDALTVFAELPGMTKEDVNITLENNILTISGQRKFEKETDRENYHRIERAYGSFARSFSLPNNVQLDKVDASFQDGVLTVELPKVEEAKPRKVSIK